MKHLTLTASYIVTVFALILPISAPPSQSEEKLTEQKHQPSITVSLNVDQPVGAAHQGDPPLKPQASTGVASPSVLPKDIGHPDRRSIKGLGTRGICKTSPTLAVLAPHPTGLTAHDQPSLYWYISAEVTDPIEFTLNDENGVRPVFQSRISPPVQPGVHQVRLADSQVRLEPGKRYEWSVALECNQEHPSNDIVAEAKIERAKRPDTTGLWYDEVMAISDLIQAAPSDMNLRRKRASLLEQVKLSDVAAYDLKAKVGDAR